MMKKGLSIVIPLMNEEENINPLYEELMSVLKEFGQDYEIIFSNDGSIDKTEKFIRHIIESDDNVKLINFRRNFGQTAAMSAGFDAATFEYVIAMDGDLQNDPKDIPKIVELLDQGYDLVSGWRKNRKDKAINRKIPSKIANWLIGKVTGVKLHDYGCSLKGYRKDLLNNLTLYGEMHRFIPVHASQAGAKIIEIVVGHRARQFGKTKYGISRTIRVIFDLMTAKLLHTFGARPLHYIGIPGMISLVLGGITTLYLCFAKIFLGEQLSDRPLFIIGLIMIMVGIQIITIGLASEIIVRVFYSLPGKKPYIIRDQVNIPVEVS